MWPPGSSGLGLVEIFMDPTEFGIPQGKTTIPHLLHPTSHNLENYWEEVIGLLFCCVRALPLTSDWAGAVDVVEFHSALHQSR
jgi:hypothetical protein